MSSLQPESSTPTAPPSTPLLVIAQVSRVVTKVADRLTGGRADHPLLVALGCVEALRLHGISAQVMYGAAAWIEILEGQYPIWAGSWSPDESPHFWVATPAGETVDLNLSVAHKMRTQRAPAVKALYSPPMLWCREVPRFCAYQPQGVAQVDLQDASIPPKDAQRLRVLFDEIREKAGPDKATTEPEFANEPILCPGKKLLDDSTTTFRLFDRALRVGGFPPSPFSASAKPGSSAPSASATPPPTPH